MIHHTIPRCRATLAAMTTGLLLATSCGPRSMTSGPTAPGASTVTTAATANTTTPATTPSTTPATTPATAAATTTTVATATTPDVATEKATIAANWARFFLPATSMADRIALLENGATLQQALEQRAKDPLQQQASATVKAVELTAPDRATVTYDVLLNGSLALPDAQGIAVLQGGVWKVGAESFCALISLGATGPIPGCS